MTSSFKTAAGPVWSPDARRIAFRTREGGAATIWTVDVDAGTLRSFAASVRMRVSFSRLHWAPAAEILFFDVNDDISAVDPESGAVRLLTKLLGAAVGRSRLTVPSISRPFASRRPIRVKRVRYDVQGLCILGRGRSDGRTNLLRRPDLGMAQ